MMEPRWWEDCGTIEVEDYFWDRESWPYERRGRGQREVSGSRRSTARSGRQEGCEEKLGVLIREVARKGGLAGASIGLL